MAKLTKKQVVIDFLAKNPTMPSLTAARAIKAKEKLLFENVEQVRSVIRTVRGKQGKSAMKVKAKVFDHTTIQPNDLPKSHAEERKPFFIPAQNNNVLVISDLHIPYHSSEAISLALNFGKKSEVNTIIINGDLLDFHGLSRFQKDPRKRSVKEEFDAARQFLALLRKKFPTAGIYWLEGNHDSRYPKWLYSHAAEIWDDSYYSLQERLTLADFGVTFIPENQLVMLGKLSITHGHHIIRGIFAPVNSARGVFTKTYESHLIGHTHKPSEHNQPTLHGKLITTWSTGCLCELNPDYSPFVSGASHGFAHVTVEPSGEYHVRNYRIYNGKLL